MDRGYGGGRGRQQFRGGDSRQGDRSRSDRGGANQGRGRDDRGGNAPPGVCRDFYNNGSCKFGDNCRFRHEKDGGAGGGGERGRGGMGRGGPPTSNFSSHALVS